MKKTKKIKNQHRKVKGKDIEIEDYQRLQNAQDIKLKNGELLSYKEVTLSHIHQ